MACCLVLTFGLLGPAQVSGRQSEVKRLALVITNPSAGADVAPSAEAMSRRLTALGFEVIPALGAGSFELVRATTRLEDRVSGDTVVVIYYSGYAVRANGEDWLIPAGASPTGPTDLANQAIPLRATMRGLREKGAVVAAIVDGCRQSRMLEALGGTCAGDAASRERDLYQVSSSLRLVPGDLSSRLIGLLVEGRTVGQVFQDIQSNFGASVVVETPSSPGSRSALAISRPAPPPPAALAAKPATPPPAPAVVRPPAPAAGPAPDMPLPDYLQEAIARADYGDREGARARAASVPTLYGSVIGTLSERDRLFVSAQISYINGDFAASARDFEATRAIEASGGATALPNGSEARRSRLQGSAYAQLGRAREAIGLLEQSARLYREVMAADEARSALLLGPVWTRLGEAYRLDGRLGDARRTLEDAIRAQSGPAKGGAFLQMARLAYDEGNWDAAEGFGRNASVDLGKASAKAGVADSYAIVGRAIYKKRREAEGEAWRYYDLAIEYDPQSAAAKAFSLELPARLALPPFESMRPTFRFNRVIESRALTCYPSAIERDAYLGQVKAEMDALYGYGIAINDYIARLWTLLSNYERRGYLQDYQDVLKGRGYRFRDQITQEEAGWKARREAVLARHAALSQWHSYAGAVTIPCGADGPGALSRPGYQPNLPPRDEYVASATPVAAPAPPAAQPPAPPPIATAAVTPPPSTAKPTVVAALSAISAPPPAAPPPAPAVQAQPRTVAPTPDPTANLVWPAADPPAKRPEPTPPAASPTPAPAVVTAPPPQASPPVTTTVAAAPPPRPAPSVPVAPPPAAQPPAKAPEPRPTPPPAVTAPAPQPTTTLAAASPPPAAPAARPSEPKPAAPPPAAKPAEPKPAPAVTTLAAATPPKATTPAGPVVTPPSPVVAPAPPPPAAAPASSSFGAAFVTPPPILFVSAPATLPVAPPPPPAVKGKPAPPKPTPAAVAQLALERGAILLAQGKYDLAQREYATAAENEPANTTAQAGLLGARGLARLQAGQVALAIDDLNASRAARPIPEVLEALGRIYAVNSNRGAAIDYFAEAIALRPGYAQAHYGRAEALRERATPLRDEAELQAAAADYKAALTARGDVPEALLGMGMARFALGDFAGAVESADAALRTRPIFPEAKYIRARARIELDQYQDALKDLVDLPPVFDAYARACSAGLAFFYLADTALVAKDKPRAIELYGQAGDEFQKALTARAGDARAKLWLDYSRQNALNGPLGDGRRFAQLSVIKARANRKGPSPTATVAYADACKRT